MITATEALSHLRFVKKEANLFIERVIEPAIKKAMTTTTYVRMPLADYGDYGLVYKKPKGLTLTNTAFGLDLALSSELTNEINNILTENGYTVTADFINVTGLYADGYRSFKISWKSKE